jgi:hypothetical protein
MVSKIRKNEQERLGEVVIGEGSGWLTVGQCALIVVSRAVGKELSAAVTAASHWRRRRSSVPHQTIK